MESRQAFFIAVPSLKFKSETFGLRSDIIYITKTDRELNRDFLGPEKKRDFEIELYEKIETVRLTHMTAKRKTNLPEP